jgi:capsular polysaccharide biosynthesis protein
MMKNRPILLQDSQIIERALPVNLYEEDLLLFSHEFKIKNQASYYYDLKFAFILNDTVVSVPTVRFFAAETHLNGSFSKTQKRSYLKKIKIPKQYIRNAVWVTQNWTWMYFHWMTDALMRLVAVIDLMDGHKVLLPATYQSYSFVSESLAYLEIPYVWYQPSETVLVKNLILPSHTSVPGNYNLAYIKKVRNLFHQQTISPQPFRKVYISRKYAQSRRVENEEAVIAILLTYGVEIHFFEHYSIEKQVQLMKETTHLIGPHGGGLTNILFLPEGAKVLEFRAKHDSHNNCYYSLASALNNPYFYFLTKKSNDNCDTSDMVIDIDQLKLTLHDFFYE